MIQRERACLVIYYSLLFNCTSTNREQEKRTRIYNIARRLSFAAGGGGGGTLLLGAAVQVGDDDRLASCCDKQETDNNNCAFAKVAEKVNKRANNVHDGNAMMVGASSVNFAPNGQGQEQQLELKNKNKVFFLQLATTQHAELLYSTIDCRVCVFPEMAH